MELRPSSEAASFAPTQGLPNILLKLLACSQESPTRPYRAEGSCERRNTRDNSFRSWNKIIVNILNDKPCATHLYYICEHETSSLLHLHLSLNDKPSRINKFNTKNRKI